jgi:hypothetical protein
MSIDLGIDYWRNAFYPVSGLTGDLVRFGTFNVNFGVSDVADILLDGGVHNRLFISARDPTAPDAGAVHAGDSTGDVEDAVIGTRVRLMRELTRRPSLSARFSTRLPNSKHESGLGLDTMDFNLMLMTGKTIRAFRLVGNFGWSILEDPVRVGIQNDVITYAGAFLTSFSPAAQLVLDVSGRADTRHGSPPVGTESRSVVHLGSRFGRGDIRYDIAIMWGLTRFDPSWGVTAGVTWVLNAFKSP